MMHPRDYLHEVGLSNSETLLYLKGLELGKSGVARLCAETGVKRPTAYHALNQLVAKGLATETKDGKELRYVMAKPEEIETYIQGRIGDLGKRASQLDGLLGLFPTTSTSIKTNGTPARTFVGDEEVKRALDLALYCSSRRWDIIAPVQNFIAKNDKGYIRYFKDTREAQGITSRSLWEGKLSDKDLSLRDIISRKPRYLPRKYAGTFSSMLIVFDTKVLIVGLQEATLLQDESSYQMCSMLFDALWSVSDKP